MQTYGYSVKHAWGQWKWHGRNEAGGRRAVVQMTESIGIGRKWDTVWRTGNGLDMVNPGVFKVAADLLAHCMEVEDWGCGNAQFRPYLRNDQLWIGVDACAKSKATVIADLATYKASTWPAGLFVRGVFEHNDNWAEILSNALGAFTKTAVLVFWTPFVEKHARLEVGDSIVHRYTRDEIVALISAQLDIDYRIEKIERAQGPYAWEEVICINRRLGGRVRGR